MYVWVREISKLNPLEASYSHTIHRIIFYVIFMRKGVSFMVIHKQLHEINLTCDFASREVNKDSMVSWLLWPILLVLACESYSKESVYQVNFFASNRMSTKLDNSKQMYTEAPLYCCFELWSLVAHPYVSSLMPLWLFFFM